MKSDLPIRASTLSSTRRIQSKHAEEKSRPSIPRAYPMTGKRIRSATSATTHILCSPYRVAQNRELLYFDFDADRFKWGPSRRVFAATAINSPQVESWLGRILEDPLAKVIDRLERGDRNALDNQRAYRAASMMLWLQGARSKSVNHIDTQRDLDALSIKDDSYIDELAAAFQQDYQLSLAFTVTDGAGGIAPLYVPSTGIYAVVVADSRCLSGYSFGFGISVRPTCALIATPTGVSSSELHAVPNQLQNSSVGTTGARRVVVDPQVLEGHTEAEQCTGLHEIQHINSKRVRVLANSKSLVADAIRVSGLEPNISARCRRHGAPPHYSRRLQNHASQ